MPVFPNRSTAVVSVVLAVSAIAYTLATFLPFLAVIVAVAAFLGAAFFSRIARNPNQWGLDGDATPDTVKAGSDVSMALAIAITSFLLLQAEGDKFFAILGVVAALSSLRACFAAAARLTFHNGDQP